MNKKGNSFYLRYLLLIITVLYSISTIAQESEIIPQLGDDHYITSRRISERVAVFTERSSINNNVIAISSKKGIVIIDAMASHITAAKLRECISKEFNSTNFIYLINTHHHFDHAWGNQVFSDIDIIAHENFENELMDDTQSVESTIESNVKHRQNQMDELMNSNPDSARRKYLIEYIDFRTRFIDGLSKGFKPTPANITFKDTLSLDLGDIHVKLFNFGPAHTSTDIFVLIPEEEILMTGDIFMDGFSLPMITGEDRIDVPNMIKVLGILLDGEYQIKMVIPGHKKFLDRESLVHWRDYIKELWEGINHAKTKGISIDTFMENNPIKEKYLYLKELGHSEKGIQNFHKKSIQAFWEQVL